MLLMADLTVERIRKQIPAPVGEVVDAADPSTVAEEYQAIGFLHGQRTQHDGVKQAEDSSVRANTEGERENGDDGHAGTA
jgi:hypothetical protein